MRRVYCFAGNLLRLAFTVVNWLYTPYVAQDGDVQPACVLFYFWVYMDE